MKNKDETNTVTATADIRKRVKKMFFYQFLLVKLLKKGRF